MEQETVRVYFVVSDVKCTKQSGEEWTRQDVTAVFPDETNGWEMVTCYANIGQHSLCSLEWAREERKASPDEYAELLAELRAIGYDPQPIDSLD